MDPDIAIIGHIINETIVFPDRQISPVLGSPAAYSSVIASVLGAPVGLVTKIGRDFPPQLLDPLREAGVDLGGVAADHEHSTANLLIYDEQGDKQVRYVTRAPNIESADVPEAYCDAALLFVCPMAYEVPVSTVRDLARLPGKLMVDLGGYGGATSDIHPAPDERANNQTVQALADAADIVKGSIEDCRHILPQHFAPEEIARQFVAWGAEVGVVTLGSEGALAVDGADLYRIPPFPARMKDATGAGDAFSAGFLVEYLHHRDVKRAVRFGCATASLVIEDSGGVRVGRMPGPMAVQQRIRAGTQAGESPSNHREIEIDNSHRRTINGQ